MDNLNNIGFIPFDIKCFTKLEERFQSIFEPKLINEICGNGNLRRFEAEETLVDIGTIITHIPLVISGSVKILTEDENGDELLLYYLELGETCSITLNCCTRKAKSTVRAVTETETEILFVPVEKMEEWMVKYGTWRRFVLESYNEKLNEMVKAIDNIVFHSLEERIIKYLNDKVWISKDTTLTLSHQDIANDLYSSRVAVSRIMKKLEHNGFLKQNRNKITVNKLDFNA